MAKIVDIDDRRLPERGMEAENTPPLEIRHDPEVVAEAMREGVPVRQMEAEIGAQPMQQPQPMAQPVDPVFTSTVDVIGEYRAALDRARSEGNGGEGPVTVDTIREATATLGKYQAGKAQLEARIIENEEYYRLQHNGLERRQKDYDGGRYRRNTAWLFSAIANKVADFQDNYPEAGVAPREAGDEQAARQLSAIIPAILERNNYRELYRHTSLDKVKNGTGIQQVVWDADLADGMGDVAVRRIDPLNIFWEPGIADIQQSANVFSVEMRRNDDIIAQYPEIPDLKDHLSTPGLSIRRYIYNESIDTSEHSYVINWYYKRRQGDSVVLHYCRYVNDVVLYASENDQRYRTEGWYRHGRYPFVFFTMYPEVGTPFGFGEIDIGRDTQDDIDDMNNEILRNVKTSLRRRYFSKDGGGINEQEFMDLNRDIVHVAGTIDENSVKEISVQPISQANLSVYQYKIDELKETGANRDVTQGGTGGTQTASGIAALQESGNKVSRDLIAASYESFKDVCELIIELVRQFYDVPRSFRILGDDGAYTYQTFDNRMMQSRVMDGSFGVTAYQSAEPVFDVSVKAAKNNPWSRQQQNQDAMNLFQMGFFAPENYTVALACLECMDLDNMDKIKRVINENGQAWEQAQQMAMQTMMRMRAAGMETGGAEQQTQQPQRQPVGQQGGGRVGNGGGGQTVFEKAKMQAQQGTQPR